MVAYDGASCFATFSVVLRVGVFSCVQTHERFDLQGDGISNVCDLAYIWSYTLHMGEESYISTQRTLLNRSTHR